jgi:zinc D-Ala-D-Ala carboxypeptidase
MTRLTDTAARLAIDNTPNGDQVVQLLELATQLERVRAWTGPLHVNSGYRCIALNRALKSDDTSQHVRCEAADLTSLEGLTPRQLCERVIRSKIEFDQLIYEYERWMHISFARGRAPRGHVITINRDGTFPGLVERKAA